MYDVVAYSRDKLRNDRPIHLLGIGGVRDIFHGVRYGIDTFDCVHPTRLGRHGGALVKSAYWEEPMQHSGALGHRNNNEAAVEAVCVAKCASRHAERLNAVRKLAVDRGCDPEQTVAVAEAAAALKAEKQSQQQDNRKDEAMKKRCVIREHVDLTNVPMRHDPRPIDESCHCYTCRNYSRAYIHQLFKAKESLAGTLTTIHNIHYMNALMRDIRDAIAYEGGEGSSGCGSGSKTSKNKTLAEVEAKYVHPDVGLQGDSASGTNLGA